MIKNLFSSYGLMSVACTFEALCIQALLVLNFL